MLPTVAESIAQVMQRVAAASTPWLAASAVALLALWLILLCRRMRPFAKPAAWFSGLAPSGKAAAVAAVCLCTLFGGSKEGGDRGGGQTEQGGIEDMAHGAGFCGSLCD